MNLETIIKELIEIRDNTVSVRQNRSLILIQKHLICALQSVSGAFFVTAEYRSPVSLFARTDTQHTEHRTRTRNTEHITQNTEHKHTTPNTRQPVNKSRVMLSPIRAVITLKEKAPRGVVCTRERLHGNATRCDAASFWRMVMQPFRRIKIFCFFFLSLLPPPLPSSIPHYFFSPNLHQSVCQPNTT